MNIAHIAPPWFAIPPENYGGTEHVIYNLIEEQVAQGHDVTLFAPEDADTSAHLVSFFAQSLHTAGVPWSAFLKAFYHFYKIVDYIQLHKFDIVHMHLSSAADMTLFPLTAHYNTPHIMTLHSRFPFDRAGTWSGDADALYMEWAQKVPMVAISESARDEVPYKLNFVGVVPHGLPLTKFVASAQPKKYFAWLGRVTPDKGVHLAIQAAKIAGVPLVIAGNVDPHLAESVDYFEQMIKPHIDDEQIKYIGPVNMQQKIDLLSRARGFLNPIVWEEPFGMVMIEAMAVGCPVITFARGAAPELVVHGKTGFLVNDVETMASSIARIGEIDRAVVRAHVEQKFSVQVMAEKYFDLYQKVIETYHVMATRIVPMKTLLTVATTPLKPVDPAAKILPLTKIMREKMEAEPTV